MIESLLNKKEHSITVLCYHELNIVLLYPFSGVSSNHQQDINTKMDLSELTQSMPTKDRHLLSLSGLRRRKNIDPSSQGSASDERRDMMESEAERDYGKELTFHGLILRSQLAEMFKNKIFFNESEGVSIRKRCDHGISMLLCCVHV